MKIYNLISKMFLTIFLVFTLSGVNYSQAQDQSTFKNNFQFNQNEESTNSPDKFISFLKESGVVYSLVGSDVEISAVGNKIIDIIPFLQSNGLMLNNITRSDIESHPITNAGGATLILTTLTIVNIYKTTTSDQLHFNVYLIAPDDYGNNQNNLLVSFDFNRTLFNRINWDGITIQGFMKVTPNFQFSNWFMNAINLGK